MIAPEREPLRTYAVLRAAFGRARRMRPRCVAFSWRLRWFQSRCNQMSEDALRVVKLANTVGSDRRGYNQRAVHGQLASSYCARRDAGELFARLVLHAGSPSDRATAQLAFNCKNPELGTSARQQ